MPQNGLFPHFPQVMDSIPPGEKQQKLQEFIDLIDPESLGAWMHRSGSVGYGQHLWFLSWVDSNLAMEMLVVYVECIDCVQDGRKKGRNNLWLVGIV